MALPAPFSPYTVQIIGSRPPVGHGISWLDVPPIRSSLEARSLALLSSHFLSFSRNKRHACCYRMIPFIYASQICWQLQKRKGRGCSGCYWRCTVCLLTADKYGIEKKRSFDYYLVVVHHVDVINIRPDVETAYPIIDALISF